MIDPFGFCSSNTKENAYEIAQQWRREYYYLDGELNKAKRAVQMHPEKYVMGFSISPSAIYQYELAKAKYEMGLELKTLLKSKPPKYDDEPQKEAAILTPETIRKAVKRLKGEDIK